MEAKIEPLSFLDIARHFLRTEVLPKQIHDALNNILTKTHKTQNLDKVKYRRRIINKKAADEYTSKYPVILGGRNAIYNILVLWYLLGTSDTKVLLQAYDLCKNEISEKELVKLHEQTKQQYLEFFCLGIVRENIDAVINDLRSPSFDLFREQLPSPFFKEDSKSFDISPMLNLCCNDIPWEMYMKAYQEAELSFLQRNFSKAKSILFELEKKSLIRLPIVETLNKKILAEEAESNEAWNYFQKILN